MAWSNALGRSMQRRKGASPALCPFRELSKRRRQCLLLTLSIRSQTYCKPLEADHDDSRKYFFDDGQKTEISISADRDFGVMKKDRDSVRKKLAGMISLGMLSV